MRDVGWWAGRGARVGLEEDASARDASSPPLSRAEKAEASAALGALRRGRRAARLALPVSLSMICNRVMSLTSVAFVGHLGSFPSPARRWRRRSGTSPATA